MGRALCLIFLFITSVTSAQNYDFARAEKETRKLIYPHPDSALVLIKRTLSQKGAIHDTVYGNTYSLYGIYYGLKGKPDSTIFYQKKALTFLDGYPMNQARSLMNLGVGYRNKGDYATSILTINKAIQVHKKINNQIGVATGYGELASNYNYMQEYSKSVDYLLKAIAIFKTEKRNDRLPAIKQKLANTYLALGNYKFAIDLYRETLIDFKQSGMLKNYYLTLVNLGDALITTKKYTEAKKVLTEAIGGLGTYGDKEMTAICLSKIGDLELKQNQPAKAVATLKKAVDYLLPTRSAWLVGIGGQYIDALNKNKDYKKALDFIKIVDKLNLFKKANNDDQLKYKNAAADTYNATNNDKEAIKAYKHTIEIMDSISEDKQREAIREVQAKFQTELQREKNLALEANNKALQKSMEAEKTMLNFYVFGGIALLVLILSVLLNYWLKNRLQREAIKAAEADKILLEQKHLHEQALTNAQKEVIDEKQRELTSTALRMANYQDSITGIIEKCETNALSKVNDVKKELQLLVKQEDYWKQFETRFNSVHPNFGNNLTNRFSKLTKNDIEFCSLLKLNLSNKEIASLLQISHESAITKKYRIKKKMEINDDAEFEKLLTEI